jgi:hypothetical protein
VSILVILCTWTSVSNTNPDLILIRNPDSDPGRQKWLTKKEASLITWKSFTKDRDQQNSIFSTAKFCYSPSGSGLGEQRSKTLTWRVFCFCWLPWGMLLCSGLCWGGSLLSPPAASERWPAAGWDPTPACSAQQHPAAQHQHLNQSSRHISQFTVVAIFSNLKLIVYFKLCKLRILGQ